MSCMAGTNSRLPCQSGNRPSCCGRAAASSGMMAGPEWSFSRSAVSGLDQNSPGSGGRGSVGSAGPSRSGRSGGTPGPTGPPGPCPAFERSGRGPGRTPRPAADTRQRRACMGWTSRDTSSPSPGRPAGRGTWTDRRPGSTLLDVVRHAARQQAGGDYGLFSHGLLEALPVRRTDGPDLDAHAVGTFAGALHPGRDAPGLDVDGHDLSPAGVGAATVEAGSDSEFLKGLEPPPGPPAGAEGAAFRPGPDAASDFDWLGVYVVVVTHRRSCVGEEPGLPSISPPGSR